MNAMLQQRLNPSGNSIERRGQVFRVGDKVMQLRNDYDKDVFNGDLGTVVAVRGTSDLSVEFEGRALEYGGADVDNLSLAYATSIHKSQGSEYPVVVLPILTAHFVMLSRHLVYTAVTRAKRLCILVADPRALGMALRQVNHDERITRLSDRLRVATSESQRT
jgi:exodeoxyribonuclease V alpha subunit